MKRFNSSGRAIDKSKKRNETKYIQIENTNNGFNMEFISDTENGRD